MELDVDKQGNEFLKCKGCHFLVPKEKLILHLKNKRVQCIKSYSSGEIAALQTYWNNFKETSSDKDKKTQNTAQTFRKCGHCKEMIACKNFDNHLKTCSGKDVKEILLKCRGCEFVDVNFNLLVHLTANDDCVDNYVKNEFSALFELWWKKTSSFVDKELRTEQLTSSMKILNKLFDKKGHVFCISCGKNFQANAIMNHRLKSDICLKNYHNTYLNKCEKCGKYYEFYIEHIHENNGCFCESDLQLRTQKDNLTYKEHVDSDISSKSEKPTQSAIEDEAIICLGCDEEFYISTILKHLSHMKKTCKQKYSEKEMAALVLKCDAYKKYTKKKRNEKRTEKNLKGKKNVLICKSCGRQFDSSRLTHHFSWSPECKKKYPKENLSNLKEDQKTLKKTIKQDEEDKERKNQAIAKIYSKLKTLLYEEYLEKCLGCFDLKKVLHSKWQIEILLASNPPNDVRDTILTLIEKFEKALEKWFDNINSKITEISEVTSRWCAWCLDFRKDVTNFSSFIYKAHCNDREMIEKKGRELLKNAKTEFKSILDSNYEALCKIGKKIDMKIIPYPFVMGNMIKSKTDFDMEEGTKLLKSMILEAKDYLQNYLKKRSDGENQQYIDFRNELEKYKYMFGDPEDVDEEGEVIIDVLKEISEEKNEKLKKLMEEAMSEVNLSFENDFQKLSLSFKSFNSTFATLREKFITECHYFLAFSYKDLNEYIDELKKRIKEMEEN